jgi:hypothetical protein
MNNLAKEIFRLLDSWTNLLITAKKAYKWRRIPIDAIETTAKTIISDINDISVPNSEEHKQAYINMIIGIVHDCKSKAIFDSGITLKRFEKTISTVKKAFKEGYKNQKLKI